MILLTSSGLLITRLIPAFIKVLSADDHQRLRCDAVAIERRSLQDALEGLSTEASFTAEEHGLFPTQDL